MLELLYYLGLFCFIILSGYLGFVLFLFFYYSLVIFIFSDMHLLTVHDL